jgi:nicotinamidase-related amidase
MKPALIVIDIQNEYLKFIPDRDKEVGLYLINELIRVFRQKGHPIYRVYHQNPKNGPEPDTDAFQFPKIVEIQEDDIQIIKHHQNAFKQTELDQHLRREDINTLFLCGLSAVGCVMATYWSALDLEYDVFMVKDAVMSHSSELTEKALAVTEAMSASIVLFMLENLKE